MTLSGPKKRISVYRLYSVSRHQDEMWQTAGKDIEENFT